MDIVDVLIFIIELLRFLQGTKLQKLKSIGDTNRPKLNGRTEPKYRKDSLSNYLVILQNANLLVLMIRKSNMLRF